MLSMIFLSDDERAQLRAQHKLERDGRIRDRIKAVLLFDKGWSVAAIAEALLYRNYLKNRFSAVPKSRGSIDRKRIYIVNINPFAIVEPRELSH